MMLSSPRFRPLALALICWLLVIAVPQTRQQFLRAWSNPFVTSESDDDFEMTDSEIQYPVANELLERYPNNENVEIYAAQENKNALKLLERKPQNLQLLTLALQQQLSILKVNRFEGPLSNPNYPKPYSAISPGAPVPPGIPGSHPPPPPPEKPEESSLADWNRFMALARRGQTLEPDNAYFDWAILYGLYATRQDALARTTLAKAARKTTYNDHVRELTLNRLAVPRLDSDRPLSPREQGIAFYSGDFSQFSKFRQTCRWVMEGVIADRLNGKHNRALNDAFNLMKISRLMRRESYSLIGSLVGSSCESISLGSVTLPVRTAVITRKTQMGSSLAKFQSDKRMLYFYANSRKRSDITRVLNTEWVEAGKWRKLSTMIIDQEWAGNTRTRTLSIIASERFAGLVLKALPSLLIFGLLYAFLSRRYPDYTEARGTLSRGIWFGLALWIYAFLCDVICAVSAQNNSTLYDVDSKYTYGGGLLATIPWWILIGLSSATICFGLNQTVLWQKEQAGKRIRLRTRFKNILEAPEDGLVRFDFGWILGLALHISVWIIIVTGPFVFCGGYDEIREAFPQYLNPGITFIPFATVISTLLSFRMWRNLPRRQETFRLSFRMVGGALAGFFVATSVLYALVAILMLPVSQKFEDNFHKAMQQGEVKIARTRLGL